MSVPAAWVPEVIEAADDVLRGSQHLIEDGMLHGVPWPVHCYRRATDIVRRTRSSRLRRSA